MTFNLWNRSGDIPGYVFHIKGRTDIIKVHITKTAGTSLSRAMNFHRPNHKLGLKKHYFAREIIDIIGEESWNLAFRFSIVRNPWDRLFSMYRFHKDTGKIDDIEEMKSFNLWLKRIVKSLDSDPYEKSRPQTDWLIDHHGKIEYDFIGRFENLNADVKKLSALIKFPIALPLVNKMYPTIHYGLAYDDESIALVEDHYRSDIEMFNYSFYRHR